MILGMRKEVKDAIGLQSNEATEKILEQFAGLSSTTYSNFSQINTRSNDLDANFINTFKEEENKRIAELEHLLVAKSDELKAREIELREFQILE
jgi:hypothetical protein